MYSYVARQPIVDRHKQIIGYELLYRVGADNRFPNIDPDSATKRLLTEQFLIHQYRILEHHLGFVNFTYNNLLANVPLDFPSDRYVIEILESCQPTDILLARIKSLKAQGYRIALDDFIPSDEWRSFYPYVDYIKFDICDYPIAKASQIIAQLASLRIEFIAERVETNAEFAEAKHAGFDYFQGYFFSQPELKQAKRLDSTIISNLRLLDAISKAQLDLDELEEIIANNAALSYQLLSFVNACVSVRVEIHSFHQALVYLGEDRIRKFVSYVLIMRENASKPSVLYSLTLQRAKFFQLLMTELGCPEAAASGYLCGMLSLLDAILDVSLDELIDPIHIDTEIKDALLRQEGRFSFCLQLAEAMERGDWAACDVMTQRLRVDEQMLHKVYGASIAWVSELAY